MTVRRAVPGLALLLLALAGCTRTRPFTDAEGRRVPGSVASMEMVGIGGVRQSLWFRGRSSAAPVLVLLHGGPGASESALFRHYVPGLEEHFVVVYWDQRGAGRSYRGGMRGSELSIARLLADLDAVVDTARARFGAPRVVLLGHSWGTILGTLYASRHPGKVAAYVGVGQVADFAEGERLSLAWAAREAKRRDDEGALRRLCAMAPRPRDVDEELALGRIVEEYGGTLRGGMGTFTLIRAALSTDEAGLMDLVRFGRGNRLSLEALRPEYARVDLGEVRRLEVPVVLLLGAHDWHVPSVLAARWLDSLDAPVKRVTWFERSAHDPPFEQPRAFVDAMVRQVLPLATGSGAPAPSSGRPPGDTVVAAAAAACPERD